jgi:hypothetical protein
MFLTPDTYTRIRLYRYPGETIFSTWALTGMPLACRSVARTLDSVPWESLIFALFPSKQLFLT